MIEYVLYFLYSGDQIVYIGRAKGIYNLKQRLSNHKRQGKIYDNHVYYIFQDYEECKELERKNIKHYTPKYNKQSVPGRVKYNRQHGYIR